MDFPALCCATLGDQGGSAYYRIVLPVMMADAKGYVQVRIPDKMVFFPPELIAAIKPNTLFFHRSHTLDHRKYVHDVGEKFDALKVYTIDDWVGKVPKESPHFKDLPHGVDKEIKKVINICDRLIVTNDVLANVYGYKKDTYIVPNYLSENVWADIYEKPRAIKDHSKPRIGWSGGMGHPGDLKILREIADILGDSVKWVFLGDTPQGFNDANCEIHKATIPTTYGKALYDLDLDLALAPLLDNDFNRAKSNLRILEYGACGYSVIASNVKPYRETPTTLLEYKAEWWAQEIQKRLQNLEELKSSGEELKKWVWENHKLEDHLKMYGDILSPDGESFVPSVPEVEDKVDIIITTHNSKEIVERCVNSVLESLPDNETSVEVIVSDNASNEAGFREYLDQLEHAGITVIKRDTDIGYTQNINEAIKVHPNRDIITLNSDTVVNGNWIDRLKTGCYVDDRISSVTPLSNNATILSYPKAEGSELNPALVKFYDSIAKETAIRYVTIPSSVGFCTFIKRKALAHVGLFDPHGYGRGYGEENDWCMRALKLGWINSGSLETYVGHVGNASFKGERESLQRNANITLQNRWKMYFQLVEQWNKANPLAALRQTMDLACIRKTNVRNRTLHITHSLGGGVETYLQTKLAGRNDVIARFDTPQLGFVSIEIHDDEYFNLPKLHVKTASVAAIVEFLKTMNVNHISVQTTFNSDYNFPQWIMNIAKEAGIHYDVMIHDYWMVCPRLKLFQNEYCGEPEVHECNKCIINYGSIVGQVDVKEWRRYYHHFLHTAKAVYAPSLDVVNRFKRYFPDLNVEFMPHEQSVSVKEYDAVLPYKEGDTVKVAVLGYVSREKGSLVIEECAKYCKENSIPMKFMVFGQLFDNTSNPPRMIEQNDNLFITGPYNEPDLQSYMMVNKCHLSFHPSLWPEVYSYTLSHAIRAGLYPIVFDMGAPAERVREMGFGEVIPVEKSKDIPYLVNLFMETAKANGR